MDNYKFKEMNYEEINEVVNNCTICILGTTDYNTPYLTPLYFDYEHNDDSCSFILESKNTGRKIKNIVNNNKVIIYIQYDDSDSYKTIIASGTAYINRANNNDISNMINIKVKVNNISGRIYYK